MLHNSPPLVYHVKNKYPAAFIHHQIKPITKTGRFLISGFEALFTDSNGRLVLKTNHKKAVIMANNPSKHYIPAASNCSKNPRLRYYDMM